MIDIDSLSSDDRATFKVYIKGGEGEPDAAGFVVVGPHSGEFRKSQARLGAKVIALLRENEKQPEVDLSDEDQWIKRDAAVNERARVVAESCVVDWFGFVSSGQPVAFSQQALSRVLANRPLWAFTVMRAVESESNFTKP